MRTSLLPIAMVLAACGGPGSTNGNWTGDVTPRTEGPTCTRTRGLATIQGDRATFSPNEGTWLLVGTASPDGRITAEKLQPGAARQLYETRLEGTWTSTAINGTYTTPRCTFDVALKRR